MRRFNAFICGACLVGSILPPHDHLWLDFVLIFLAAVNGMNALSPEGP